MSQAVWTLSFGEEIEVSKLEVPTWSWPHSPQGARRLGEGVGALQSGGVQGTYLGGSELAGSLRPIAQMRTGAQGHTV